MTGDDTQPLPRRYTTLWIMLFLFGLPYIAAGIFYAFDDLRESLPKANHGTLVSPIRPLPAVTLEGFDGQIVTPADLRGQWILLYANRSVCDRPCEEAMYFMRQVRLAMGRERFGIERIALLPGSTDTGLLARLGEYQPDLHLTRADSGGAEELLRGLNLAAGDRLYVIDPLGNQVLFYTRPYDPEYLLDDLKRLIGGRG